MPRLFWKLFLALWLSIMGFAVVMAWVNATLAGPAQPEVQAAAFERRVSQLEKELSAALQKEDRTLARTILRRLPRQLHNHVFLFDENGKELLGRDAARERLRARDGKYARKRLTGRNGEVYVMLVLKRLPTRAILEPGHRGVFLRLLFAALLSAVVSFFLARYLAKPLEHLGSASRRLAAGDLSVRIGAPLEGRRDEFGSLAADFDEMAARLQDLQTANRRLLRDVSHELRSPLARLRVALEIARNRDQDAVSGELDRIELESERLEILVDEVLDLLRESSESSPLHTELFDLCELLSDIQGVVNYEAPDGTPGVILEAQGPIRIEADRELLWRAVENLIRNALIHTDASAGVLLAAAQDAGTGNVDIVVGDRGPGLPAQHLKKIFEPFYRAQEARDRNSGGHGLGLAIAAAAVRRHHGTIAAVNREGGGLEIRIGLPGIKT
jgi:two-component system sensor histidine kinase CpxA